MPGLLREAGDLHPHALQEAGNLGGSFELGYRIELLERRRKGVREAPECAGFELRVRRITPTWTFARSLPLTLAT